MLLKNQIDSKYKAHNQLDSLHKVHIIDVGQPTLLKMFFALPTQHAKRNTFSYDFRGCWLTG